MPTRKEFHRFNEIVSLSSTFANGATSVRNSIYSHSSAMKSPVYFFNNSYGKPRDLPNECSNAEESFSSSSSTVSPLNLSLPLLRAPPALIPSKLFSPKSKSESTNSIEKASNLFHFNRISSVHSKTPPPSDDTSPPLRRRFMSISDYDASSHITKIPHRGYSRSSSDSSFDHMPNPHFQDLKNIPVAPLYPLWQHPFIYHRLVTDSNQQRDREITQKMKNSADDTSCIPNVPCSSSFFPSTSSNERKHLWSPYSPQEDQNIVATVPHQYPWLTGRSSSTTSAEPLAMLQRNYPLLLLPAILKQFSSHSSHSSYQTAATSLKMPSFSEGLHNQAMPGNFKNLSVSTNSSKDLSSITKSSINFAKGRPISSSSYDSGCVEPESDGSEISGLEDDKQGEVSFDCKRPACDAFCQSIAVDSLTKS